MKALLLSSLSALAIVACNERTQKASKTTTPAIEAPTEKQWQSYSAARHFHFYLIESAPRFEVVSKLKIDLEAQMRARRLKEKIEAMVPAADSRRQKAREDLFKATPESMWEDLVKENDLEWELRSLMAEENEARAPEIYARERKLTEREKIEAILEAEEKVRIKRAELDAIRRKLSPHLSGVQSQATEIDTAYKAAELDDERAALREEVDRIFTRMTGK